jgi:hypothetical protein
VTAFARALAAMLLVSATARAAEHEWPAPPHRRDADERVAVSLETRAGLVDAPFVTTAFPEVSGFATLLTPAAGVRFPSVGWLRLRLPVSVVRLDFPAGAQVAETALGNLELGVERPFELRPPTRLGFSGAFVAPTATHGPETALLDNRTLALSSALGAHQEQALLTPGVVGVRLGASVEHDLGRFTFSAAVDLPMLVRISDASLPADADTHAIGVLPALDVQAALWITSWFGASLGGGVLTEPWRVQEPSRQRDRRQRLQFVLEPGLHFTLGDAVRLGLDGDVPVGGSLGGDAWSLGLRGRFGF